MVATTTVRLRTCRHVLSAALAYALALALGSAAAAAATDTLWSRVAPPAPLAIAEFHQAGMRAVRNHLLTPAEQARIEAAFAALPALHRTVLEQRLRHLSFVDGLAGNGSGLTAPVAGTGQFDITLRASLIDETLSTFLTTKERRLFEADGSHRSIVVEATGTDALTYVLLHEATHVVDSSTGLTAKLEHPLVAEIWTGLRDLAPPLAGSAAATTTFRGGHRIAVSDAATVYDALAQTPFVSLYAVTTAQEDVAELVAWNVIGQRFHGTLVITVMDADGRALQRYTPLRFPAVMARMARVDALLAQVTM